MRTLALFSIQTPSSSLFRVITDPLQPEFVIFAVKKLHMYVYGRALIDLVYHIKLLLIFA